MAGPSGRTLTVYLAADTKNAARDMDTFAGKMKSVVGPALAGAAAAAGLFAINLGVDAVQGAIKEQAEIDKLNELLRNNGFADATADVDAFLSKQAQLTTFTDSDLRPAFEKLFIATGDVKQAQELLTTAMDTAIGSGNSLETTVKAVSKAADGNLSSLNKLIPGLETTKDKTATLDDVTGELADRFSGQATKAAQTWEGQLGNVADAFGELQDSFGQGFLEGLAAAIGDDGGKGGINGMTQALIDLQEPFKELGTIIGDWLGTIVTFTGHILDAKKAIDDFRKTIENTAWGRVFDGLASALSFIANGPVLALLNNINAILSALERLKGTDIGSGGGGSWGGTRSLSPAASKSTSPAPQYNITVNAGVGNPVEIARSIENILRTRNTRLGMV